MESTKQIIKNITEKHNGKMENNTMYKNAYENKHKPVKIMTF